MSGVNRIEQSADVRMQQAIRWFARMQAAEAPDLESDELLQWEQWAADPSNSEAFCKVKRLWQRLDDVPRPEEPGAQEVAADTFDGSVTVTQWLSGRFAARHTGRNTRPNTRTNAIAAKIGAHKKALALAAGVAALGVGVAIYSPYFGPAALEQVQSYETGPAQHRNIELSDGSKITFGGRTALSTHYTATRRVIVLDRGEAWFSVARDRQRPFTVLAGNGAITAIGTQFNVRRDLDAPLGRVTVTVTEGVVDVAPRNAALSGRDDNRSGKVEAVQWRNARLIRGEALTYDTTGERSDVTAANVHAAIAWKEGRLEYHREPLNFVIPDVNRYSLKPIVLADNSVGELVFSGTVFQGQVNEWVRALETALPIDVEETGERIIIRTRTDP